MLHPQRTWLHASCRCCAVLPCAPAGSSSTVSPQAARVWVTAICCSLLSGCDAPGSRNCSAGGTGVCGLQCGTHKGPPLWLAHRGAPPLFGRGAAANETLLHRRLEHRIGLFGGPQAVEPRGSEFEHLPRRQPLRVGTAARPRRRLQDHHTAAAGALQRQGRREASKACANHCHLTAGRSARRSDCGGGGGGSARRCRGGHRSPGVSNNRVPPITWLETGGAAQAGGGAGLYWLQAETGL